MSCNRLVLSVFSVLIMIAPSCKKYKPAPEAFHWNPSEVRVAPGAGQGTSSHKITDLWLYVNGQFQGAYPATATLPIISKGQPATINIVPGIMNNGISSTRIPWLLYQSIELDTLVAGGTTLTKPLTFQYNSAVTFTWTEDFERGPGFSVTRSSLSDTTFRLADASESFEGSCIELGLKSPHLVAQIETAGDGFALPEANGEVYLELNYKCNGVFSVGLIGDDNLLRPVLNINPQDKWNKIYIQLAQAVNSPAISSRYKVFFRLQRGESQENLRVFLDNIKLVYL